MDETPSTTCAVSTQEAECGADVIENEKSTECDIKTHHAPSPGNAESKDEDDQGSSQSESSVELTKCSKVSAETDEKEITEAAEENYEVDGIEQAEIPNLFQDAGVVELREQMRAMQEQMSQYHDLMEILEVTTNRNSMLEEEAETLKSSHKKLNEDFEKVMTEQEKQLDSFADTCSNFEREIMHLKLQLAQIHTKDDFLQQNLSKMATELDGLKDGAPIARPSNLIAQEKRLKMMLNNLNRQMNVSQNSQGSNKKRQNNNSSTA